MVTVSKITASDNGGDGMRLGTYDLPGETVTTPVPTGNILVTFAKFEDNSKSGLFVYSKGTVSVSDTTASRNLEAGAILDNSIVATPLAVTLARFTTDQNNGTGLSVLSKGAVTVTDATLQTIWKMGSPLTMGCRVTPVTIKSTKLSVFNGNINGWGLNIFSHGTVTLTGVIRLGVTRVVVQIQNENAAGGVTITGTSNQFDSFSYNTNNDGLAVFTTGPIKISYVAADSNMGLYGAEIDNSGSTTSQPISITNFSAWLNEGDNMRVTSSGAITLSNVEGILSQEGSGAFIDNTASTSLVPAPVTIIKSTFNVNGYAPAGLQVFSKGIITLNGVTANYNGTYDDSDPDNIIDITSGGALLDNSASITGSGIILLNTLGTNYFNFNNGDGLSIVTDGSITLTGIAANSNRGNALESAGGTTLSITTATLQHNLGAGVHASANGIVTLNTVISMANGSAANSSGLELTVSTDPVSILHSLFIANYGSGIDIQGMSGLIPVLTDTGYFGNFRLNGKPNLYLH